jgi:hypothetical protein
MLINKHFFKYYEEAGDEGTPGGGSGGDGDPGQDKGDPGAGDGDSLLAGAGNNRGSGDAGDGDPGDGGEGSKDWFLAEGVKGEGDKPDWFLADKYKSVEEQAKAYPELAKKLGGFTGAPEQYELTMPEGIEGEVRTEDPLLTTFVDVAKELNMSQDAFNKVLHTYIAQEAEAINTDIAGEMEKLGPNAKARVDAVADWAKANLDEEQFSAVYNMATSAANIQALEAIIGINREGRLGNDGGGNPGMSKEELKAMRFATNEHGQRLMEVDPEYRRKVEKAYRDAYGDAPRKEIVHGRGE